MNQCIDHGKKGNKKGYRSVYVGGGRASPKFDLAHRVALARELGRDLLPGEVARHTCDNPRCVNPRHLVVGSHVDNMQDCKDRERLAAGERHSQAKLTLTDVEKIRASYTGKRGEQTELAKLFGVSHQLVSLIVRRKLWA